MTARSRSFGELSWIFTAALREDTGQVITLLSELTEGQLVRVVEAAQLIDREANDYGDGWFGWNGLHKPFDPNEAITLADRPHSDAPDYAAGEVGDYDGSRS